MKSKWKGRIGLPFKNEGASSMLQTSWISKAIPSQHASVVQIGSNDGKTRDPLYPLMKERIGWRGLFVEPVPYLLRRLRDNYMSLDSPERFRFYNGAVNDGSKGEFFYVDRHAKYVIPDLPEWYDQIGSFDRQHILNHLGGILAPFIKELELAGSTLQGLLDKFQIDHVDLLHIDTEGYDWVILSQLNLERYRPSVILFEYKHLNETDLNRAVAHVSDRYEIFRFKNDLFCLLRERHGLLNDDLRAFRKQYTFPV
ncbi:hypothetical protein ADIS_2118 [Lunatimonas lonarensis]|uniref:Methyltransferase FkbM domain-containing protein n=1 Tax=Lunatimonas lonarensis TaxID=1232681 RepID=R7ZTS6_9BACT|nr:FkbM family methyltransferase [Lunatimonas lonarensis]EON77404.1 hypothetical protein ADIS_2118 [Lunatimonas lonarensis]